MSISEAILVAPVDPECRLNEEEVAKLQNQIEAAEVGDVIVVGVPVQIYHLISGVWVLSEDLPEMLSVEKDKPVKREPKESTFCPPGVKNIVDDD